MNAMTTPMNKQFPKGAEWVRADFHLHTKADKEFKHSGEESYYNSVYVEALEQAGIRLGVVNGLAKKLWEFGLINVQSQRTVIPTVGRVERKRPGQCSAAGCYSNQIPGDGYCYDHKSD